jgi:hypothetical protein
MSERQEQWNISYLGWDAFRRAVLSGQGQIWDEMMKGDLVIGGMDFSIDFM